MLVFVGELVSSGCIPAKASSCWSLCPSVAISSFTLAADCGVGRKKGVATGFSGGGAAFVRDSELCSIGFEGRVPVRLSDGCIAEDAVKDGLGGKPAIPMGIRLESGCGGREGVLLAVRLGANSLEGCGGAPGSSWKLVPISWAFGERDKDRERERDLDLPLSRRLGDRLAFLSRSLLSSSYLELSRYVFLSSLLRL